MTTKLLAREEPAIYKILTERPRVASRSLRSLGTWTGGGTPSKAVPAFWTGGTIPWVSPKDMKVARVRDAEDHITPHAVASSATSLVKAGAVVMVVRSGILKHSLPVAVTDVDVALNQDMKALQPAVGVDAAYVAWALRANAQRILHRCTKAGTTVQSIEMPALLDFKIPLPLPAEQTRVVETVEARLSLLDASVAGLHRVQANLKRYRASVLKSACEGRLVPTEAEIARQEGRDFETGEELLRRIVAARASSWDGRGVHPAANTPNQQRLPALPEGWAWASAEQLCGFITKGTTPAANKLSTSGAVQFLKVYNLTDDGVLNHAYKPAFVSRETHEGALARSRTAAGDVLMNIVGPPLGQVCVVPPAVPEANINQAIARFRTVLPEMNKYLAQVLLTKDVLDRSLREAKTTVGQVNLTLQICREIAIPLPPLAEQHRIVAEADRRLSLIRVAEAQVAANLARAQRLRQSILQAAFAG